jgi:hypothetical protein
MQKPHLGTLLRFISSKSIDKSSFDISNYDTCIRGYLEMGFLSVHASVVSYYALHKIGDLPPLAKKYETFKV